jgi:hypothetical protein
MSKCTPQKWEHAVRKARQYVRDYSSSRWIISELALEVCDIYPGGRKSQTIYSVSKFSEEIEIDRKTLYEWIRVKKLVLDKLPKMVRNNPGKYLYTDFEAVAAKITVNSSVAEVRLAWNEHFKRPPETKKFEKYLKGLNALIYNVTRPMVMKDVEEHLILQVIEKTNLIKNLSEKELQFRKKYPNATERSKKRVNVRAELEQRITRAEKHV